jgi:hypothetical protein
MEWIHSLPRPRPAQLHTHTLALPAQAGPAPHSYTRSPCTGSLSSTLIHSLSRHRQDQLHTHTLALPAQAASAPHSYTRPPGTGRPSSTSTLAPSAQAGLGPHSYTPAHPHWFFTRAGPRLGFGRHGPLDHGPRLDLSRAHRVTSGPDRLRPARPGSLHTTNVPQLPCADTRAAVLALTLCSSISCH